MRPVIVTRPLQQAQPWVDALHQNGFKVMHIPLLSIQSVEDTHAITQAWANIAQWRWVMFVSANAVQYFFKDHKNIPWPAHLRAGVVGNGTAQALTNSGVPVQLIDQPAENQLKDSASLWQIVANRGWENAAVLLVRGVSSARPPRDWLIHQLKTAGAHVNPLVVYQRTLATLGGDTQAWLVSAQARKACWLFSSSEALENLPDANWPQATAIATHPRIAQAARHAGFGQVICTQPDLQSVIDSVKSVV